MATIEARFAFVKQKIQLFFKLNCLKLQEKKGFGIINISGVLNRGKTTID
jgi:hypothetical protein